jgi:signal transduction histidine kinase
VRSGLPALLDEARRGEGRQEGSLRSADGFVPIAVTACALPNEGGFTIFCLVLSDVSDRVAAEQLRARQEVLARQRAELDAIFSRLPFAVLLVESPDTFTHVNAAAESLMAGHPDLRSQAGAAARRVLEGAGTESEELSSRPPGAIESTFRVYATPLVIAPAARRALVVIEDVTAERLAERARERQEQLRETFVGILGHDLRTPLMVIMTASELLGEQAESPETRKIAERLGRAAHRMRRLIEDMLDLTLSRIGGGIPVTIAPTDLEQVVRPAIDELIAASPVQVEISVEGDVGGVWDEARLEQVVTNLLRNAVEHGATEKPVRVSIDGSGAHRVRLSVKNHGPPIAPELIPTLFDPFRRGIVGQHARGTGVGLGLYITDQIVSAHGGAISVSSSERDGTIFTVELPRRPSTSPES